MQKQKKFRMFLHELSQSAAGKNLIFNNFCLMVWHILPFCQKYFIQGKQRTTKGNIRKPEFLTIIFL